MLQSNYTRGQRGIKMYKLLIVDDEQIEREGMAHFIQWDKYDIQLCGTAWNGADALGKIQKDVPDIVLTDIKMPVMNGIELIQKLSETYRNIVVVVLSGYGEYEFTSQAMEYGIRHYILKPCDEDKIVAVMNDAKKEVDKRREYHTLKRELLPHAKEELFRRLLTGSRLSDDEIMALKKDFPANGDSYRLLAMKNEVSGFEYIEQFILGNILGEILQMATMPLFTYVDDMVIFAIDVCTDNSLSKAVERTLQEFARMKSKAIASAASLEGDISVAHELYKQLLYLFTMVDNKTDAGLLCYPTQNEAESNTYYFDFDDEEKMSESLKQSLAKSMNSFFDGDEITLHIQFDGVLIREVVSRLGKDITINKTIAPIENDHQWYETRVEGIIFNTGLMNWIRQFGPMIIVVGPEKLKEAITDGLEENLSYYKK
jgi:two-component system response regulator YesN